MLTALDAPEETLDERERTFVGKIRQYGWFCTTVADDGGRPMFSYSTGIWLSTGQPECIVFGLKHSTAYQVLWDIFNDAKSCRNIEVGKRSDAVFSSAPAYAFLVATKEYADNLGWSRWFYHGDVFPCLQIIWPDRSGVFPWEGGYDEHFRDTQPDLTEHGWRAALLD